MEKEEIKRKADELLGKAAFIETHSGFCKFGIVNVVSGDYLYIQYFKGTTRLVWFYEIKDIRPYVPNGGMA